MKTNPIESLRLSEAVEGFMLDAAARRLSPGTLADYSNTFRKFRAFCAGDPPLASIDADTVRAFLVDLATPKAPNGAAPRPARPIGKKQALNVHTGLSALWTWAVREGITERHVLHEVRRPQPERPAIVPFSEADMKALLAACGRSRTYSRAGKRACDNRRPTGIRDAAILLLLLDTGLRASELCGLRLRDVDLKNRYVIVMGKGDRERMAPISGSTAKALWKYLNASRKEARLDEVAFVGMGGRPLTRDALQKLLLGLGERASVADCHPHRFRHTFAIQYLRNGGNVLALQASLGHSSLEMVRVYARVAQADLENGHRVASPVENWRL